MLAEIYMWQMEQELRDLLQISKIASTDILMFLGDAYQRIWMLRSPVCSELIFKGQH